MTTDLSSAGYRSPATSWRPLSDLQQCERKAPVPASSYGTAAGPLSGEHTPMLTTTTSSPACSRISRLDLLLRIRLFIHLAFFPLVLVIITSFGARGRNLHAPFTWGILLFLASYGTFGSVRQLRLWRKQELSWKRMFLTSLLRAAIWMPVLAYHVWFASVLAVFWFAKGGEGLLVAFAAVIALFVGGLFITEVAVGGVALAKMRQEKRAARVEL